MCICVYGTEEEDAFSGGDVEASQPPFAAPLLRSAGPGGWRREPSVIAPGDLSGTGLGVPACVLAVGAGISRRAGLGMLRARRRIIQDLPLLLGLWKTHVSPLRA